MNLVVNESRTLSVHMIHILKKGQKYKIKGIVLVAAFGDRVGNHCSNSSIKVDDIIIDKLLIETEKYLSLIIF
jgi:hypothetical protein